MTTSRRRGLFAFAVLVACGPAACATSADPPDGPTPAGEDTVYLLIRSDDAGMTHAVNLANRRLFEAGLPVSVSIMFPTPWWQETVAAGRLVSVADAQAAFRLANERFDARRWAERLATIYRAAVVEHRQLTEAGRLRAPSFKGFREDKTPEECTYDQLAAAATPAPG